MAERCYHMAEEGVRFLPRLPTDADHDYRADHDLAGVDLNVMTRASRLARQALMRLIRVSLLACLPLPLLTGACSDTAPNGDPIVDASSLSKVADVKKADEYVIGSGDSLSVFVYRNPDLSEGGVAVRPDGRISTPLIEDIVAAGKTPTTLAREIEERLKKYIQEPNVTVIVRGFIGPPDRQVRVIGEATDPIAIPYRDHMSLLDVMIAIKGLTKFASGNRSIIVRTMPDGKQLSIRVRINDLIKDGDISQNLEMAPGDTLIIPQSWF